MIAGSCSFDVCLNQLRKSLQDQPKTVVWNQSPRPQPKPAPCPSLNKDVNEASNPHGEQDKTQNTKQAAQLKPAITVWIATSVPTASTVTTFSAQDKQSASTTTNRDHRDRDWIVAYVGKVRDKSLRIIDLREGATEGRRRRKAAYQAMSRIYHPDKHNSGFTDMSDEEAVEFFHHLNNAHSYLREIM
jgi:hypothetical protein